MLPCDHSLGTSKQQVLERLMQCLEKKIKEVQQRFYDNIPENFEKIRSAIVNKDRALLKSLCHDFSGSTITFGYKNMAKIAKQMEEQAFTSTDLELKNHVERMNILYAQKKG